MNNIEHKIQADAFKVIRLLGKTDPFYSTIHAIPNGGKRSIGTAVKLKAEGVLSGVPDIFVPAISLYIEVKAPDGELSIEQSRFLLDVYEQGYRISIARSTFQIVNMLSQAKLKYFAEICEKSAIQECYIAIEKNRKSIERKAEKASKNAN